MGQDATGTVTGTGIKDKDPVAIRSKTTSKKWAGEITGHASGNIYNAKVRRVHEGHGTETVGVTVTNNEGASNEKETTSNVP